MDEGHCRETGAGRAAKDRCRSPRWNARYRPERANLGRVTAWRKGSSGGMSQEDRLRILGTSRKGQGTKRRGDTEGATDN